MPPFKVRLDASLKRAHTIIAVLRAKYFLRYENGRLAVRSWFSRHAFRTLIIPLPFIVLGSVFLAGFLEPAAQEYFHGDRLTRLSSLIVTIGAALVGSTAIAFSVVVFSVQINIERTPEGLFQTLSRDRRLILAFLATVFMSIVCASL